MNGLTEIDGQALIYHSLEQSNGFKPYWTHQLVRVGDPVKKFTLATVDSLSQLGMVRINFFKKEPWRAEITTSGRNYLKSLSVPTEDRLNLDVLHRIHQLVYNPMQREKKRK